jgi:hypothetical protein
MERASDGVDWSGERKVSEHKRAYGVSIMVQVRGVREASAKETCGEMWGGGEMCRVVDRGRMNLGMNLGHSATLQWHAKMCDV